MRQYPLCKVEAALRISAFCTAFVEERSVGFACKGESHDFWESVFILEGKATVTAGETVYLLMAGQMIFHPPTEFHRLANAGDTPMKILIISFAADAFPIREHRICAFPAVSAICARVEELRSYFITDGRLLLRPADGISPISVQYTVNRLENYFLSLLEDGVRSPVEQVKSAELYSVAVSVMHRCLGDRLTAQEIARQCGMSISSLQKLFLRYTGMGMMRYYNNLRMQHARQMLERGTAVKEVALLLGFEDQNYFSTAFRRHFGFPPSLARGEFL